MNSISQGLVLMIIGMAVVFSFLVLLVFVMGLLSAVSRRFFPDKEEPVKAVSKGPNDAEIAAAVAAANAYAKS